jgi:hypothetical protein
MELPHSKLLQVNPIITGMLEADISEINKRTTLNRDKLCILATIAGMDINELLEIVWVDE